MLIDMYIRGKMIICKSVGTLERRGNMGRQSVLQGYLYLLCVVSGYSSVVNQGVVFEGWGDLAFSSQTHTLGLVLDTSNITKQLEKLSKIVLTTGTVASEHTDNLTPYFVEEVKKIAVNINETRDDISNFLHSFSETNRPNRQRRFTNIAGYVIGSSLGLATDSEINDLVSQINAEHTHTHKVMNQVISHLEVTDKQLGRLGKATNKIELAYQGLTHHTRKTGNRWNTLDTRDGNPKPSSPLSLEKSLRNFVG